MCDACREKNRFSHARAATKRKREGSEAKATTRIENSHDPEMKALEQDDIEPEPDNGISGEGWDQMRKRTKMEFADSKGKEKVPVKSTELKVRQFITLSPSFITEHN
jgi:hypothetical protein